MAQAVKGKGLPLVLTFNCLPDCELERDFLKDLARVHAITAFSKADVSLLKQATVVVLLSLNDVIPTAQQHLRHAQLVVCIGSGNPQLEAAIAEELGIQRLVHVNVQLVDEATVVHPEVLRIGGCGVRLMDHQAADTTLALMLGLLRRTHQLAASCTRGVWAPSPSLLRGAKRCSGLTLGLLGLDNVALAVAQRAAPFGFQLLYFDPLKERDREEAAEWAQAAEVAGLEDAGSMEELLASSDIVSLHCAACEETVGILSEDVFAHFKQGALLVNTSSSELLDENALRCALLAGSIGGAALDSVEGFTWFEAWVRDLPNLVITPRSACFSDQAFTEQRLRGASVIKQFLKDGSIETSTLPETSPTTSNQASKASSPPSAAAAAAAASASKSATWSVQMAPAAAKFPAAAAAATNAQPPLNLKSPTGPAAEATPAQSAGPSGAAGGGSSGSTSTPQAASSSTPLDLPRATSSASISSHVDDVKDLVDGMVVAVRFAGGITTPVVAEATTAGMTAGASPSTAADGKAQLQTAAVGAAATEKKGAPHPLLGSFYRVKHDAARKTWDLEAAHGVSKMDPCVHLTVIRRKQVVGFRAGIAEGRTLQLNKQSQLVFANRNFGTYENWDVSKDGDTFVLTNRKWKSQWRVMLEVIGEVVDGIVRWKS